jgi:hypothetical protein
MVHQKIIDHHRKKSVLNNTHPECPITKQPFKDPCVIGVCGHTFEREAIIRHLSTTKKCPLCQKKVESNDIHSNFALRDVIQQLYDQAKLNNHKGIRKPILRSIEILRERTRMFYTNQMEGVTSTIYNHAEEATDEGYTGVQIKADQYVLHKSNYDPLKKNLEAFGYHDVNVDVNGIGVNWDTVDK